MGRRTLLLIAALLVAALGTALIWLYVQGADKRARDGYSTVSVYAAVTPLLAGAQWNTLQKEGASLKDVPQSVVPPGAVTVANASQLAGLVLRQPVSQQAVLTLDMFVKPGDATSSVGLAEDKLAIEVSLADPARVAGLLRPGSEITIFATLNPGASGDSRTASTQKAVTWVFLDRVLVLSSGGAVGTTVTQANGTLSVPQALVGLQVSSKDAQKIVMTQNGVQNVSLWFALRGSKADVKLGDRTTEDELLGGLK